MRSRTLMASAGALALTLLSGCLGTYTGDPETRGPRNIEPRTRPDLARERLLEYLERSPEGAFVDRALAQLDRLGDG